MSNLSKILNPDRDPEYPHALPGQRLSAFGRMSRENRIYLGVTLHDMAKALEIGSADLSGYESGRLLIPDEVETNAINYFIFKFSKLYDKRSGN
jgi:hypothetical protein